MCWIVYKLKCESTTSFIVDAKYIPYLTSKVNDDGIYRFVSGPQSLV